MSADHDDEGRYLQPSFALKPVEGGPATGETSKGEPVEIAGINSKDFALEREEVEIQKLRLQNRNLELTNTILEQNRRSRKSLTTSVFVMTCVWLVAILFFVWNQGRMAGRSVQYLETSVLVALVGSTSVNVIGLFYVVLRYLFPNRTGGSTSNSGAT